MTNRSGPRIRAGATSFSRVATAIPTGAATHSASRELTNVPTMKGSAPYHQRLPLGRVALLLVQQDPCHAADRVGAFTFGVGDRHAQVFGQVLQRCGGGGDRFLRGVYRLAGDVPHVTV